MENTSGYTQAFLDRVSDGYDPSDHVDGLYYGEFDSGAQTRTLFENKCKDVPTAEGVYIVTRANNAVPTFLPASGAGKFKGKDPSFTAEAVDAAWVRGARVMYIGKAAGAEGLKQRIKQLVDFGFGKPVGHSGGAMIWHLADHATLQVRWKICSGSADYESKLIGRFCDIYKVRPFGNKKD